MSCFCDPYEGPWDPNAARDFPLDVLAATPPCETHYGERARDLAADAELDGYPARQIAHGYTSWQAGVRHQPAPTTVAAEQWAVAWPVPQPAMTGGPR